MDSTEYLDQQDCFFWHVRDLLVQQTAGGAVKSAADRQIFKKENGSERKQDTREALPNLDQSVPYSLSKTALCCAQKPGLQVFQQPDTAKSEALPVLCLQVMEWHQS